MRKLEKQIWSQFAEGAPGALWLQRVESPMTLGLPDTLYAIEGEVGALGWVETNGWIETKRMENVKPPYGVKFQPYQPRWHERWGRAGGNSFILIGHAETPLRAIYDGSMAYTLRDEGADPDQALHVWEGATPWPEIMNVLAVGYPEG